MSSCWFFSYGNDGHQRKKARAKQEKVLFPWDVTLQWQDAVHDWSGPARIFMEEKPSRAMHGQNTSSAGLPPVWDVREHLV